MLTDSCVTDAFADDIRDRVSMIKPKFVLTDEQRAPRVVQAVKGLDFVQQVFVIGQAEGCTSVDELLQDDGAGESNGHVCCALQCISANDRFVNGVKRARKIWTTSAWTTTPGFCTRVGRLEWPNRSYTRSARLTESSRISGIPS